MRQGRAFFRTVFFLPSITPMVVLALVWMWLYAPKGMINTMLLHASASTARTG